MFVSYPGIIAFSFLSLYLSNIPHSSTFHALPARLLSGVIILPKHPHLIPASLVVSREHSYYSAVYLRYPSLAAA